MDYAAISKEVILPLYKSHTSLRDSPLDLSVILLVELRTSQINGCAYCCGLHTEEARKLGIIQEKLDKLVAWRTAHKLFSNKERAALAWCDALTIMKMDCEKEKELLFQYYSEREIVDLTACIALMNALNRIAIHLKD